MFKIPRFKLWLMERDLSFIISKNPNIPEEVLTDIYNTVGDKYWRYLVPLGNLYKRSPFNISELENIIEDLAKSKVDIGRAKTFEQLQDMIEDANFGTVSDSSTEEFIYTRVKKIGLDKNDPDFPLVYKNGEWEVFEILSYEAALRYTPCYTDMTNKNSEQDLGWCTGGMQLSKHFYDDYKGRRQGRLFVFYKNRKPQFQYFESGINDSEETQLPLNKSANLDQLISENPELKGFNKLRKAYDPDVITFSAFGYTFRAKQIDADTLEFNEIVINHTDMTSLTELPWVNA